MTQEDFLKLALEGRNVDLSGYAGSGKTYILKKFIDESRKNKKKIIIVAPTGIAAINVGGATVHSAFKIYGNMYFTINKQKISWAEIDTIIIDEKSMIGPDLFDHMSNIVSVTCAKGGKKKAGEQTTYKSFGGKQVIVCGDMAQLPPIYKKTTPEEKKAYMNLKRKYGALIYSSSKAYKEGDFVEAFLTKIYRQQDNRLIDILNDIRDGDRFAINDLQKGNYTEEQYEKSVHLMPYNNMVDAHNKEHYDKVDGKETIYYGEVLGKFNTDNVLSPVELFLKPGCRVMLTKNNFQEGLYNGDMGTVKECFDDVVTVDFDRLGQKDIFLDTWENIDYNGEEADVIGSFTQIPLRLAYGLTIHKSQGLSLANVIIHYVPSMTKEALYVAVSRAESYDNLFIK